MTDPGEGAVDMAGTHQPVRTGPPTGGPVATGPPDQAPAPGPTLRPVRAGDEAFLVELYASTRADELAATGWNEATRTAFLAQQFAAQDRDWRARLPDAAYDLVCVGEERVGRLYVDRRADAVHVVDVSLLPEWRGRGIGGRLLAGLAAEADAAGVVLSLHVDPSSPAIRLYQRLGLRQVAGDAIHLLLERRPHPGAGGAGPSTHGQPGEVTGG